MRSTTAPDFREALQTWGAPSVNMVYADTAGDICWQAAAYVPKRTGWRGMTPVSGDGRFEWNGYMTAADLPGVTNPDRGFVHSANEMNVPEGWDHDANPIGFEWFEDGRADRIADVISSGNARDVAGNRVLQTDTFSTQAVELCQMLPDSAPTPARDLLRGWNGHADAASAAALLYEIWLSRHLRPALLAMVAPDPKLRAFLTPGNVPTIVRLLRGDHPGLALRAGLEPDILLSDTLHAAWVETCETYGTDTSSWQWGQLHQGYFNHALTPLGSKQDVGPLPTGGAGGTVMLGHYEASDYRVTIGASVRIVVDVGAWDNSVWINAPGQSALPDSTHFNDLAPLWAAGDYVPMLYSADAVDKATQTRINLVP